MFITLIMVFCFKVLMVTIPCYPSLLYLILTPFGLHSIMNTRFVTYLIYCSYLYIYNLGPQTRQSFIHFGLCRPNNLPQSYQAPFCFTGYFELLSIWIGPDAPICMLHLILYIKCAYIYVQHTLYLLIIQCHICFLGIQLISQ